VSSASAPSAVETLTLPYDDLVRKVIAHHRAQGELVDFWLMKRGAIVGMYRVRKSEREPWTDLLPTGTSPASYHKVIQRLAPVLFPDRTVVIKAIGRDGPTATVTYESAAQRPRVAST
jgi:hypothetical protein